MDTNVIQTLLSQLPESQAIQLRMEHTLELIVILSKYTQEKPEHAGYYESILNHLSVVHQSYAEILQGINAKCRNQVH